jgi:hypothetical protein
MSMLRGLLDGLGNSMVIFEGGKLSGIYRGGGGLNPGGSI